MNPKYPQKRSPIESIRVSTSNLRSTPNFKASHISHTDEHDDIDHSREMPVSHKSFDMSTGLTSRSFLKPAQQRRPLSNKKERPDEPSKVGSFESSIGNLDSYRKPTKSGSGNSNTNRDTPRTFKHKISEMTAQASQRSLSLRDKPFFAVPLMEMHRKSQDLRPPVGSSREREEEYSSRVANLEAVTLSPSEIMMRYQSCVKAYEELLNRNKQAEESLRLEVIRGEEQRAYIEVLKRVIEENKSKVGCQMCLQREQKMREEGYRSDRKKTREDDVSILNVEMEILRTNENRLTQEIETFRDRLKDANTEREVIVNQLDHSHEVSEKLNGEIRKLRESLLAAQKELAKSREENIMLVEKSKDKGGFAKECEKLREEMREVQENYEDLKLLSNEIDYQRKMGTKMLEEEIKEKKKLEEENGKMMEKLKQVEGIVNSKEQEKEGLEKMLEGERGLVRELQEKLEVLEDNYSTLRMTLNENENELERLKEMKNKEEGNGEEMNRLRDENGQLKGRLEEIQKSLLEEKEKNQINYESSQKKLRRLSSDLRSAYSSNGKVKEECDLLRSEKNVLVQRVENLEEAHKKETRNSIVGLNANEIVKKYESRERLLKTLKDQVNLLEKENSLLKNSHETSRQRNVATDKLKEENTALNQKNELIAKKFHELREKWDNLRSDHTKATHEMRQLREELQKIERDLIEIVEAYLPQGDVGESGSKKESGRFSDRVDTEEEYGKIGSLMQDVKKKIERLNEKYNQAKLDLVREMERCAEVEREAQKDSVAKRENIVLKEKFERVNKELVEVDKERNLLKISNDNLLQKFSYMTLQIQSLKKELGSMHNKENHGTRRSLVETGGAINDEIKLRDAMIRRLDAFVYNTDVKELLDEMMHIESKILALSRAKEKAPLRNSMRSVSTIDPNERKENSFLESQSTMKGEFDEAAEGLEIEKAKKDTLENELGKLEVQERKRYDSLSMLEKQNFELKSEISRLMTELEINFSEYKDNKSEYYSRKMNERFTFSNGYDFGLEGMDQKLNKDATMSEFHMDYSMEKISDDNGEVPYYS